jgi:anti-anti-sigma regulatory factor
MAIIDLGRLRFMDLTGVRLLVSAQERARDHGYDVAVVPGCGGARRILELVGAQVVLNLVSDPSKANRACVAPSPS